MLPRRAWLAVALLLAAPAVARESARADEAPLFTNVSEQVGLAGTPGKTVVLADLDGDGWLDIVLDRRRVFLSRAGASFAEKEVGIEFPRRVVLPMTPQGEPDLAKAAEREVVPHWVYFLDLDNDRDLDAVCGVHSDWERWDERQGRFVAVPECDPGVRTAVWRNDGKGRFTRGPASALTADDAWGPSMALAAADVDRDGRIDLFEGREYRRYGVLWGCGGDRLWMGDGKGGFEDATEKAGMGVVPEPGGERSARPTYGVTVADFDDDGWPDLLQLAYGRQWNRQWRNKGDGTFEEVGRATGFAGDDIDHGRYPEGMGRPPEPPFRANGNTFDCAVGDYDNDGDLDAFLGEIQHAWAGESSDPPSLLVNLGKAGGHGFERRPVQEFLPPRPFRDARNWNYGDMHASWLDFDLDGRLDLLIASGDYPDGQFLRLYRQREDGGFDEATEAAGFGWEGCGGLSVGDYDRDGDPDILVGRSFARLSEEHRKTWMGGVKVPSPGLFRNEAQRSGNHWLSVRLVGKGAGKANAQAVGARVRVATGGVVQTREVRVGSGLANHQDPTDLLFGLGKAEKADRVTVSWPDARRTEQSFEGVPADRFVTIVQGEAKPRLEAKPR